MTARLLALTLLLVACQRSSPEQEPSPTSPTSQPQAIPAPAEAEAEPGVREDGSVVFAVTWFDGSLQDALARAKAENKRVLAKVGAYWCPPCQRLDEEVFVDPEVAAALAKDYVLLYVDAEKGEGPRIAADYHVQAFPTLLVLEPSGLEQGRIVDFVPKDELLAALQRVKSGDNVLAKLEQAVQAAPNDLAKRYELGHAYAIAANRDRAQAHFDAILQADPRDEQGLASAVLFDRATYIQHKLDDDLEGAIATLRDLQRRFPTSEAATRAPRQIARAQHALGRTDEATATLDAMLAARKGERDAVVTYGWVAFRDRCNPARGLEVVQEALREHGSDPELHYLQAELAHLTGDRELAQRSMQRAAELEPNSLFYRRQVRRFDEAQG